MLYIFQKSTATIYDSIMVHTYLFGTKAFTIYFAKRCRVALFTHRQTVYLNATREGTGDLFSPDSADSNGVVEPCKWTLSSWSELMETSYTMYSSHILICYTATFLRSRKVCHRFFTKKKKLKKIDSVN